MNRRKEGRFDLFLQLDLAKQEITSAAFLAICPFYWSSLAGYLENAVNVSELKRLMFSKFTNFWCF